MPPIRSITSAAKPVKTERTHEENQERYVVSHFYLTSTSLTFIVEHTLQPLAEVTVAWKLASSLHAELLKFTSEELAVHYESPSRML